MTLSTNLNYYEWKKILIDSQNFSNLEIQQTFGDIIWNYIATTKKLHLARSVSKLWIFPLKAKNCCEPCVEYILRTFCDIKSQSVQNFDTKDKILSTNCFNYLAIANALSFYIQTSFSCVTSSLAMTLKLNIQLIFSPLVELFF